MSRTKLQVFQDDVVSAERFGGFILVDGTSDVVFLLANSYDCMRGYGLKPDLCKKIIGLFGVSRELGEEESLSDALYLGLPGVGAKLDRSEAMELWLNEVYKFWVEAAPKGYRFAEHRKGVYGWLKVR